MADPHWTSYVGMITGITGAIMGFVSYRKVNSFKSLDLRLELRKSVKSLHQKESELAELITNANRSRVYVSAAAGMTGSGSMKQWENQVKEDTDKVNQLKEMFPGKDDDFSTLSTEKLEYKLVEVHDLQETISGFIESYKSSIEEDDKTREHIRRVQTGA